MLCPDHFDICVNETLDLRNPPRSISFIVLFLTKSSFNYETNPLILRKRHKIKWGSCGACLSAKSNHSTGFKPRDGAVPIADSKEGEVWGIRRIGHLLTKSAQFRRHFE
jgi:hypothetical protein